ncbi:MAG TPA: type II secretion system F family protein [Gemmatimonadaceae bacterium]|nr:type II secretion system F family protein [Gemmatimonadaceae bacterium]
MTLQLIVVGLLVFLTVAIGGYAISANRRRLRVISRADARGGEAVPAILVADPSSRASARIGDWAKRQLPDALMDEHQNEGLLQAGFDSPAAPAVYGVCRLVSAIGIPLLAFAVAPRDSMMMMVMVAAIGIVLGLGGPAAALSWIRRRRQERIRRSLPDTLDMLLVCVEAGVSLDSGILRVGREMREVHPELANELLTMSRKMNAGMRREDALHELFTRTGVHELHGLASNMIQSERWGTSIGKVLRVYSETLRRKRRQLAEKKAAVAATKMVIPLALFILPAMFVIVGGPAAMGVGEVLDAMSGG